MYLTPAVAAGDTVRREGYALSSEATFSANRNSSNRIRKEREAAEEEERKNRVVGSGCVDLEKGLVGPDSR
jgi:hypothetical protein